MIVLVMGVSGVGKTTIGRALAADLGWRFLDADDFHPPGNVAKMAAGIPLEDADRWPWLARINQELILIEKQGASAVLGCSALKHAYRTKLASGIERLETVYLYGDFDLIRERAASREHRFMPATLLQSQFDTLEPPAQAIALDVSATVEDSVARIKAHLSRTK